MSKSFLISKGQKVLNDIKPIDYNFYNLDREERYDFCFQKTIEYTQFAKNIY